MAGIIWVSFVFAIAVLNVACLPNAESLKGSAVPDLPENWDQAKDDTQSLFVNKNNKNDLEPYPLALSDDANDNIATPIDSDQRSDLENLVLRSELYGEPTGYAASYEIRRKRGSGTKVGGAGATKIATKTGGKKNKKPAIEINRSKRDSGLSPVDVRTLLALWEAQERRKQEANQNRWADRYYTEEEQPEVDDNGEIWYNEPIVINSGERDGFQQNHPSFFSEQNRLAHVYPGRQYIPDYNRAKRFMISRKRAEPQIQYRPREDLYTLAELLRAAPHRDADNNNNMQYHSRHAM